MSHFSVIRSSIRIALALLVSVFFLSACRPKSDETLKKSVVKVFTTFQGINFHEPWNSGTQSQAQECGCVVFGNRILTTAQIVNQGTYIEVQKFGETKRYTAKVDQIAGDMDLALLTVEDKDFFKGTDSADLGELPMPGAKIKIFGGDELSIKEDTVSGLKFIWSVAAFRTVPALLTNGEILPASYGCPVFSEGKLVGIPIDTTGKPDKTGSLMPVNMVQRFFKGIKDGRKYDGFPDLGIITENMENPVIRAYYKMAPDQTGQLITRLVANGSAVGVLKEKDILLAIDGHKVDNEGYITLRKSERIEYDYLDAFYMMGEEAPLEILRDGKVMKVKMPMKPMTYQLPYNGDSRKPTYFMYAGFVFVPLTYNYLQTMESERLKPQIQELCMPSPDQKPIVLLSQVLPHEINNGYRSIEDFVVKEVNGQPIKNMKDVINAFNKPLGKFNKIVIDDHSYFGSTIIFDATGSKKATQEIMEQNKMTVDRSDDLK